MTTSKTTIKKFIKLLDGTYVRVRLKSSPTPDGSYVVKNKILKPGEWKAFYKTETKVTTTIWEEE